MWRAHNSCGSHLLKIMLHIVDYHPFGRALKQDLATILCLRYSYAKDHDGDEGTSCGICVEALRGRGLPDDDGRDDDADVVDGITDDMDQHPEHAQIASGFPDVELVVSVLGMIRSATLDVSETVSMRLIKFMIVVVRVRVRVRVIVAVRVIVPM